MVWSFQQLVDVRPSTEEEYCKNVVVFFYRLLRQEEG